MKSVGILAVVAVVVATPAAAKDKQPVPKALSDVVACRAIADSAERLACFDASVGRLSDAQSRNEIVVTDRATARESRRRLFGFAVPNLGIFGDDDKDEVKEIESTIASAYEGQRGWVVTLADGAVWAAMESRYVGEVKAGQKVRIRRASLGSYMMSIDGAPGLRAERVNR